ncbi:hypothetical protein STENM223S_02858 [Streptomyces tendae]
MRARASPTSLLGVGLRSDRGGDRGGDRPGRAGGPGAPAHRRGGQAEAVGVGGRAPQAEGDRAGPGTGGFRHRAPRRLLGRSGPRVAGRRQRRHPALLQGVAGHGRPRTRASTASAPAARTRRRAPTASGSSRSCTSPRRTVSGSPSPTRWTAPRRRRPPPAPRPAAYGCPRRTVTRSGSSARPARRSLWSPDLRISGRQVRHDQHDAAEQQHARRRPAGARARGGRPAARPRRGAARAADPGAGDRADRRGYGGGPGRRRRVLAPSSARTYGTGCGSPSTTTAPRGERCPDGRPARSPCTARRPCPRPWLAELEGRPTRAAGRRLRHGDDPGPRPARRRRASSPGWLARYPRA